MQTAKIEYDAPTGTMSIGTQTIDESAVKRVVVNADLRNEERVIVQTLRFTAICPTEVEFAEGVTAIPPMCPLVSVQRMHIPSTVTEIPDLTDWTGLTSVCVEDDATAQMCEGKIPAGCAIEIRNPAEADPWKQAVKKARENGDWSDVEELLNEAKDDSSFDPTEDVDDYDRADNFGVTEGACWQYVCSYGCESNECEDMTLSDIADEIWDFITECALRNVRDGGDEFDCAENAIEKITDSIEISIGLISCVEDAISTLEEYRSW